MKTRKKSNLITTIKIIAIYVGIIAVIFILFTYIMNKVREKEYKKEQYIAKQQDKENSKRNDDNILFEINDKYVNQYGYITDTFNSSAIKIQGITLGDSQEQMESTVFENLLKVHTTLKNNELLDKVNKLDVTDTENVKIYMDSENKIIQLGDFENLTTKFVYVKKIMEQEKGKSGTIFANDISKVYFRKNV